MITVTKEFKWDMAHMLAGHDGLCKNLHGHTYKMEVTAKRKDGRLIDDTNNVSHGMVMDFKELSTIVKQIIIDPLDHAFMSWVGTTDYVEKKITNILLSCDKKVVLVPYRPTAENMVNEFMNKLNDEIENTEIEIVSIRVWETPTSYAEIKS